MLQTLAKKDDNAQSKTTGKVFNTGRINQAVRQRSLLSFYETVYAKYVSSDFTDAKQFISRPQTSSRYLHQALVIYIITKRARSSLCTGKYFMLLSFYLPLNCVLLLVYWRNKIAAAMKSIYSPVWFTLLHAYTEAKYIQQTSPIHVNFAGRNEPVLLNSNTLGHKELAPKRGPEFQELTLRTCWKASPIIFLPQGLVWYQKLKNT